MQHHKQHRKLGRESSQRTALLRTLAHSLILHERITTTEAKAKEMRPFVEKLVTKAKTGTAANRRDVLATLGGNTRAMGKLFKTMGPRYAARVGGYTRIVKTGQRKGDASKMAVVEFV